MVQPTNRRLHPDHVSLESDTLIESTSSVPLDENANRFREIWLIATILTGTSLSAYLFIKLAVALWNDPKRDHSVGSTISFAITVPVGVVYLSLSSAMIFALLFKLIYDARCCGAMGNANKLVNEPHSYPITTGLLAKLGLYSPVPISESSRIATGCPNQRMSLEV